MAFSGLQWIIIYNGSQSILIGVLWIFMVLECEMNNPSRMLFFVVPLH